MDFTKEECIAFIENVRQNELLYNPKHEFYKNRTEREEAWNCIAGVINKPVTVCKRKWRHLRDHFLRGHVKRGNAMRTWAYYEALSFLEFLRPSKTTDGKQEEGEDDDDVFSETEESQAKRLKTSPNEPYSYDNNNEDGLIPVRVITEDNVVDDLSIEEIHNDRDTDMFMVEISNRIKRLPHQLQDIAKVNILAHITELELQNEQC
ncbi:uncharacterized protein [Diabrotica undecimpunctata]|uniref:uncharacterized protein n=1 Tax=Diabrotica undecimpunctata TaxID=50387 RepID=UPI003B63450F